MDSFKRNKSLQLFVHLMREEEADLMVDSSLLLLLLLLRQDLFSFICDVS